jgi:subtilase family serine protease
MKTDLCGIAFRISALIPALALGAYAQAPVLITQPIDESNLVTLAGNVRPEATAANDRGPVADGLPMEHMFLQLQRSPQQEQVLEQLIDQLHNPQASSYHQWLTAAEFGQRFGLAQADLNAIGGWLQSYGFRVNVYPSGMLIDFSGTAGQVRAAFHTQIDNLSVAGTPHIANMSNPQIPAALAPAVAGIVSLHNFWPKPMNTPRGNYTTVINGFTYYLVVPGDLAVIYNINPLFTERVTGAGQTVVVVEDSDIYSTADWTNFRSTFGLNRFPGSLVTANPPSSGTNNCTDPGVNGDDIEAEIDMEYAGASAPGATVEVASCADTATTFGGTIAIVNILNASTTPPAIMSMSYGECEAFNGASANASFNSAFQQAVTEGVSVFVSSGDANAAGCDRGEPFAIHGIGITGWGETPYNVSVGGTDFADTYLNQNSLYWAATNTQYDESARSYIPETPWNDSCAGGLLTKYFDYTTPFGINGFCNSSSGQGFLDIIGGSGGPSACATGAPAIAGVVDGTCQGYAKPSWQAGVIGIPSDGVRDIPDVSLFASNGFWGHFYPVCYTDPAGGGVSCAGAPNTWPGYGGTSFSSPIMAGIQALVNQVNGARQGNPNYVYYKLAAGEYGASGNSACNSDEGRAVSSACIFYDVTLGDMDVPCTLGADCFKPSGIYGVLSTSNSSYQPAYKSAVGWDFATGIGTVNAYNLVQNWRSVAP